MDIGESLERAEADPLADSERIYRLGNVPAFGNASCRCPDPECEDDHEAVIVGLEFEFGQVIQVALGRMEAIVIGVELMRRVGRIDQLENEAA
jgi:hypothetical protein